MSAFYETHAECVERTKRVKLSVEEGRKRPKDHVGYKSLGEWKAEECLAEVNTLKDGSFISFSDLARRYQLLRKEDGMLPGNAWQIVKEYL